MQRIHDEDFTGYLLNTDPAFKHVKIQAIAEKDETWRIKDGITRRKRIISRKMGEALHPERENIEMLQQVRSSMGVFNFSGQYQQNPAPREGALIKRDWFHFYDPDQLIKDMETKVIKHSGIVQSWDTANKVKENNDYSACITMLYDNSGKCYLLESYRAKLDFPSLIKKVKEKYDLARSKYECPIKIYIEDQGSGVQLIQTLKSMYKLHSDPIKPEYDKVTRLQSVSHLIENGSCMFPNNNPHWWSDFENELLRFPKTKHDDQCDALSQVLGKKPVFRPFRYKVVPPPRTNWNAVFDVNRISPLGWL